MEAPHKKLLVWQKAFKLAKSVYLLTNKFPRHEQFGIIIQIRRCAVSVVSNIAEGAARFGDKEKIQFFITARGSLTELETQLELCLELKYFEDKKIICDIREVGKLLNGLIRQRRNKL